jgi:hypothetical protein
MDVLVLKAFAKYAMATEEAPSDYYATRAAMTRMFPGLEKRAWNWHGFKEGLQDEGIPLTGATLGAGVGTMMGKGLTGGALGYAVGGGASILKSKLRGEDPSESRNMLAAGAAGYGTGGLLHALGSKLTHGPKGALGQAFTSGKPGALKTMFHGGEHGGSWKQKLVGGLVEEGLPALGATLGTAISMGRSKKHKQQMAAAAPQVAQ